MTMPNFLIVGAAKSGTTALHQYLSQHPDIHLPARQEPSFFAFEGQRLAFRGPNGTEASVNRVAITSLEEYRDLYRDLGQKRATGDISPVYLYWPSAAHNIKRHIPWAKIIVALRNPADRAYSAYMHAVREGKEPLGDFGSALAAEPQRIRDNWGFLWRYADTGWYAAQLHRYYRLFPAEQIKVVLFDELIEDPVGLCKRLQHFLGVDPSFAPDVSLRHNVSGVPKSRFLHRLLKRQSALAAVARQAAPLVGTQRLQAMRVRLSNRNLSKPPQAPPERDGLLEGYRADIREVEALTGKDLSPWLAR